MNIGLLGFGVVGRGVYDMLAKPGRYPRGVGAVFGAISAS